MRLLITSTCSGGRNDYKYLLPVHLSNPAGLNLISGITGVRYARGCHPSDLWTKYFTSSKYVLRFREEHGEPDVIEIRQTFNDSLQAREWEEKVLRRMNVVKDERWINRQNRNKEFMNLGGYTLSLETRRKQSTAQKGRKHSEETRKKISEVQKGKTISLETRRKQSESRKGKSHSPDHSKKIAEANKGKHHCSEETRKKISEATKRAMASEAIKIKIIKPKSKEHKKKLSTANKGKPRSVESRRKQSQTIANKIFG